MDVVPPGHGGGGGTERLMAAAAAGISRPPSQYPGQTARGQPEGAGVAEMSGHWHSSSIAGGALSLSVGGGQGALLSAAAAVHRCRQAKRDWS